MHEVIGPALKLDQSPELVWSKLSDLSVAHNYVPGLSGSEITTELKEGVGASRQVFSKRPPMDETVLEWNEQQNILLRLHVGEKNAWGPFKEAFFQYAIRPNGEAGTVLQNSMRFELKGGAIGEWLGSALMRKAFASSLTDVTYAQRLYYQTAQKVTPEQLKAAKNAGAA